MPVDTEETFEVKIGTETVKLPVSAGENNIKELVTRLTNQAAANARKEAEAKLKEKYAPIEAALKDSTLTQQQLQQKLEEFEMEKLSAEEKAKKQFENALKAKDTQAAAEKDRADKLAAKYKDYRIQNDIRASLAGFNLFNPEQTMLMMLHKGKAELVESDSGETTVFKINDNGSEVQLSPREFAEKFLALPEYANQIKNNLIPGGGTSAVSGQRSANGKLVFKRSDMAKSADVRKEYADAKAKNPDSVEIVDV